MAPGPWREVTSSHAANSKWRGRVFSAMKLILTALLVVSPFMAAEPDIDQFLDRFSREWLRGDPQRASDLHVFTGEEQDRMDRALTPATLAFQQSRVSLARKGLVELKKFDRAKLTPQQRISAASFEWQLEDIVRGARFQEHRYVFEQMFGLQTRLPELMANMPVRNEKDARNYLARLTQVGARIDEAAVEAKARARKGILPPKAILEVTIEQMKRLIGGEPSKSLWVTSFADRLDRLPGLAAATRKDMLATAEGSVSASIQPAYQRAIEMLASQRASATEEVGFWRLPQGAAAYGQRLISSTTTAIPAARIHQIGLDQVVLVEKEIDRLLALLGETGGTRAQRLARVRAKRPGVIGGEPDARAKHIAAYTGIIRDAEKRAAALFDMRPKAPVEVRRVPLFREANSPAYYTTPTPDGSRPGIFWTPQLNPPFVASRSLAYHEAVPGHHFQLALQGERADLPLFRRYGFLGFLSGFTEGWGLYAERLAWEQGWYEGDLHGELDYLTSSSLFRAQRLVVDTGLHAKRWTIEQGVEYGIRRSEVERYVTVPGQACSYKLGELKIVEERERAKRALGAKFSIKEFHNAVLAAGAVPLDVLPTVVDEYIRAR